MTDANQQFFRALRQANLELMEAALQNGANVEARDEDGFTPLHHLIICVDRCKDARFTVDHFRAAVDLFKKYSPNCLAGTRMVSRRNIELTVFQFLVSLDPGNRSRKADMVRVLVDARADLEDAKSNGVTPLIMACMGTTSHPGIVRLLLDAGANPETKDVHVLNALMLARHHDNMGIVRILLGAGADPETKDANGVTALMMACARGVDPIVAALLHHGADAESKDNDERNALLYAIVRGHLGTVQLLLEAGSNPNPTNNAGTTALMLACDLGVDAIAAVLLDNRADVESENINGWNALDWAVERGNVSTVQLLLNAGLSPNHATNTGVTALMRACRRGPGREECAVALLNCLNRDELASRDKDGWTAITWCSKFGDAAALECILRRFGTLLFEEKGDSCIHAILDLATFHLTADAEEKVALPIGELTLAHWYLLIRHILSLGAGLMESRDDTGAVPVAVAACRPDISTTVLDFLVQECPAALRLRDDTGGLAIHQACRTNALVENIGVLVKHFPGSVQA